ncbi:adenylate/guanylate cyclase domain-containing protein [Methylobacterium aquaticum]|uniref:Adenylate cyclase n=1 Tax=Methylobacterium aquaticum TaxID=270351 RepID=A0A0J6S184_9HYPH|nr:adenylate/guanylate cyclase domain-containing protein [Methylobacterium aquaticum]KMO27404.1 adenylate cyclase [Methylobacterium aquaticum]
MTAQRQKGLDGPGRVLPFLFVAVCLGLVGLPVAVWLDLRGLSEQILRLQATETGRLINDMMTFYAEEVVNHVVKAEVPVTVTHDFQDVPGAIPLPATLSLEIGRRVSAREGSISYRFVSDYPFKNREPHPLDAFEREALAELRARPVDAPRDPVVSMSGSILDRKVRIASPIVMAPACVQCHNSHPLSPKTDWAVGDVRGIQEITIHQPIRGNILAFKWLFSYLVVAAVTGFGVILIQGRQANLIRTMNRDLSTANQFLASVSSKIAKYLPPQIFRRIFSGEADVVVRTERKKLTIFFSDIKDFTASTERLQPEELTALLNEYFTEMAAIAERHGGTIDKFIGDAMLVFFGDPESRGVAGDARACLAMALEMQRRLTQLNVEWRRRGIATAFQARMGISTGYCNVGNFGSDDRMDYTIIGAAVNLAARLQQIAEPGGIMLSFETYAQVSGVVRAVELPPIQIKGIVGEIVCYRVEGPACEEGGEAVISEHLPGLDLHVDIRALDPAAADRARARLAEALTLLDARPAAAPSA